MDQLPAHAHGARGAYLRLGRDALTHAIVERREVRFKTVPGREKQACRAALDAPHTASDLGRLSEEDLRALAHERAGGQLVRCRGGRFRALGHRRLGGQARGDGLRGVRDGDGGIGARRDLLGGFLPRALPCRGCGGTLGCLVDGHLGAALGLGRGAFARDRDGERGQAEGHGGVDARGEVWAR